MGSVFTQVAAVVTSLILALPPGWCGGFTRPEKPAKSSCCHAGDRLPCHSPDSPVAPGGKCCCWWDATTPNEPVRLGNTVALAVSIVGEKLAHQIDRSVAIEQLPIYRSGPPLHVLHCVWRC
jgi:hypothetical protein